MSSRTSALIENLREPDAYPHETSRIEVIETHISFVVLTGHYAYKIKKDVRLPFVDFSTLERRRHYCQRELELNRRTAAELYLDVIPIGGAIEAPVLGETPAIEVAVKMRQFGRDHTADRVLEDNALTAEMLEKLAERLTGFHASLDPIENAHSPIERMHENLDELAQQGNGQHSRELPAIRRWVRTQDAALEPTFGERKRAGFIRDCHGDLHLRNLAMIDGALVPFDCLEFDDDLRRIDVADEIAFLAMDLMARQRDNLAQVFLNACLQETGDYACLAVIRYYLVHRALVRSKVLRLSEANDDGDGEKRPFLALVHRLIRPETPLLVITMGFSGSGKTTMTAPLIASLPAIRVRSDIERKRIHGLSALASSDSEVGGGIYDERANEATYARLRAAAEAALAGRMNLIVDAAFLSRADRKAFRDLAVTHGARCVILNCTAPESILRERLERRKRDRGEASEAGTAVLDAQLRKADLPDAAERDCVIDVDTSRAIDMTALADRIRGETVA